MQLLCQHPFRLNIAAIAPTKTGMSDMMVAPSTGLVTVSLKQPAGQPMGSTFVVIQIELWQAVKIVFTTVVMIVLCSYFIRRMGSQQRLEADLPGKPVGGHVDHPDDQLRPNPRCADRPPKVIYMVGLHAKANRNPKFHVRPQGQCPGLNAATKSGPSEICDFCQDATYEPVMRDEPL